MSGARVDLKPSGKPVVHGGSGSAYSNYGCRCAECTEAFVVSIYARRRAREGRPPRTAPYQARVKLNFDDLYQAGEPHECWNWSGTLYNGYGSFGAMNAHRWAYIRANGPVAKGIDIDHLCHSTAADCQGGAGCLHRSCVNPAHLEAVPHSENMRRMREQRARLAEQHNG